MKDKKRNKKEKCNVKVRAGKSASESCKKRVKSKRNDDIKANDADVGKLENDSQNARLTEILKTAREMLKDDKKNLKKLGKHELMAFYDTRFKEMNDGKGAFMIVFGDTLNMSVSDTIMVASCANVMLKDSVYAYAINHNEGEASIYRVDNKPVTIEDGKTLVKAYEEFMIKGKKAKCPTKAAEWK